MKEQQAVATTLRALMDAAERKKLDRVDVFGVAAIATLVMNYTVGTETGLVSNRRRATMALAKDGEKWKVVHGHFSITKSVP